MEESNKEKVGFINSLFILTKNSLKEEIENLSYHLMQVIEEKDKEVFKLNQIIERQIIFIKKWIEIKKVFTPEWQDSIFHGWEYTKDFPEIIARNPFVKEDLNLTQQSLILRFDKELFNLMKKQAKELEIEFPTEETLDEIEILKKKHHERLKKAYSIMEEERRTKNKNQKEKENGE